MPLSAPAPRKPVHTRDIQCHGYKRDDGLWDIEGRLVDTKTYAFENKDRGVIESGTPVHDMRIRMTVDDGLTLIAIEAEVAAGPYHLCAAVEPAFESLKGLAIQPGWRRQVLKRLGGVRGCTHMTDMLLGPLAVTALQTVGPAREKRAQATDGGAKPPLLDTCHALRSDGPVVARDWPEFHDADG